VTEARTLGRDYKHARGAPTKGGTPAFSGWMGMLAGLAMGLSVAFAVFLHYNRATVEVPQPSVQPPASAQASDAVPPEEPPASDYTFYKDLPEMQVDVLQENEPAETPGILPKGDIVLQAGSFKQPAQAEKLIARLAQYGITARIQRFALQDETWYRVRIGPIGTVKEYEEIMRKLADADVEATPFGQAVESPPP
jgi:cell division protein FtsN